MTNTAYREHPAFSYSTLKQYLRSSLHGLTQQPPVESAAMRFGTAVELGFKNQLDSIVVNPHDDGRTKAAREFKQEHVGRLVLTQAEMDRVLHCVASLKSHPAVQRLSLNMLAPDVQMFGDYDGVPIKGMADWAFGDTIVDLKTTGSNIEPSEFARTVDSYHYDLQAAVYARLLRHTNDNDVPNFTPQFFWVVVENEHPFDVCVYQASERVYEIGNAKLKRAIANVKLAQQGGFLGTSNDITLLNMPPWYGRKFDDVSALPE